MERLRRLLIALRWPAICWIVVFWRLGYSSLQDPDEAHYAELTREMLRAGNWLVPLLNGSPYIDKPVLFHWLQGAFIYLFGESELALRLPAAFAAVALFWMVRWAGTHLFGKTVGDWGGIMFATIPATFLLSSIGILDMLFAAFLFGGLSCLIVSAVRNRERLQYPGWMLITLAVMTKGPVALVLLTIFFVAATVLNRDTRALVNSLRWPTGVFFAAMAASPWFMWMWGRFGDEFFRGYVLAGNLWYMTDPLVFSTRQSSYVFYLRTFSAGFFPWSLVVIGCGVDTLLANRRNESLSISESLLWTWTIVVVGFFTVAGFKIDTYIFPTAPACCLLAANGWRRASEDAGRRWTRVAVVAVGVLLVAAGAVAAVTLFQLDLGLDWTAAALPVALTGGGAAVLWQTRRNGWRPPNPAGAPLAALLSVYAVLVLVGYPVVERARPTAVLGRWLQQHAGTEVRLGSYGVFEWRASLRYYTDRRVEEFTSEEDVERFLDNAPNNYVLMLRRDYRRLRDRGLDIKVVQGRPLIAGRSSGKLIRRQIWDELVVVADRSAPLADASP